MELNEKKEILNLVRDNLDRAEKIWTKNENDLSESLEDRSTYYIKDESVPSHIPGYENVDTNTNEVDEFI